MWYFWISKKEKLAINKYNIINANCVLEHVLDPEKFLMMIDDIRKTELILGSQQKHILSGEIENKNTFIFKHASAFCVWGLGGRLFVAQAA